MRCSAAPRPPRALRRATAEEAVGYLWDVRRFTAVLADLGGAQPGDWAVEVNEPGRRFVLATRAQVERDARRDRSRRARLIAEQLGLLALVCVIICVATVVVLRAFLVDQLDHELAIASAAALHDKHGEGPGPTASGTINGYIYDGALDNAFLQTDDGQQVTLPDSFSGAFTSLPVDGRPHSRELGQLGSYRLIAVNGSLNETVVITGLPIATINENLGTTASVLGGVSLVGLAVAGSAGVLIVRRTFDDGKRKRTRPRRAAAWQEHKDPAHACSLPLVPPRR
jgi:hypothetical protein